MAIKVGLGKLTLNEPFETLIREQLSTNGFQILDINVSHTAKVINLPFHHRDPFNRLLIAQAITEEIPIISSDEVFDEYGATRFW